MDGECRGVGLELQLLFRRGEAGLGRRQAALLIGQFRHHTLVVRGGNAHLAAQRFEAMHFAARDDAALQAVAHGLFVQLEQALASLLVRLRADGVDEERLAEVLRGRDVLPLPVRDDLPRQRLFGERALTPSDASDQKERRRRDDEQLEDVRQARHEAQRRRAGKRVERHKRRERRDGEHRAAESRRVERHALLAQHRAETRLDRREGEQADRASARKRRRGRHGARHDGEKEEARGDRVVAGQECGSHQPRLVGPRAAEVVGPRPRLQVVVQVEGHDHAGKRVIRACLGRREDLFPVAVLLVDVGAGRLAGRARGALGVRRVAQPARLGVELLDKRDRTDVVAPRLAREHDPDGDRAPREQQEKRRQRHTVAVGGDQSQPERDAKRRQHDVIAVGLQPRPGAPMARASESGGNLRDPGQRADAAPAVIAGNHEHQRKRGDRHGPEQPARNLRHRDAERDQSQKHQNGSAGHWLHPPRIGWAHGDAGSGFGGARRPNWQLGHGRLRGGR